LKFAERIIERLPLGLFGRRVLLVAGGTAIGQGLAVAVSPFLTRLYTPSEFGQFAVYASLLGIVSVAASLRYEWSIPLPKEDREALSIVTLCGFILVAVSIVLFGACAIGRYDVALLLGKPEFANYLWLVPLAVFLVGSYQIGSFWAIRRQAFSTLSTTKIHQGLGSVITQLSFGILGVGTIGLLIGDLVGRTFGALNLGKLVYHDAKNEGIQFDLQSMRSVAYRYRRFPMVSTVSSLINSGGLQLPTLILATLFGTGIAGAYALVQRVIIAPAGLLTQIVSQVYLGELTVVMRTNPSAAVRLFFKLTLRLLPIALLGGAVIAVFSPWLFGAVFGKRWQLAGEFARIIGILLVADITVSPLSMTLIAAEKQSWQLAWDMGRMSIVVIALIGSAMAGLSSQDALGIYVTAMIASYIALWFMCFTALSRGAYKSPDSKMVI
jgi:O-antigen/teichoic acid export membrane protein